jgi:hypothetical protein
MAELTLPVILQILQTAGILVGIFYYLMVLNNQQKNQEMTLHTRWATFFQQVVGPTVTKDGIQHINAIQKNPFSTLEEYNELITKNQDFADAFLFWRQSYEHWGAYLREGIIDVQLLAQFNVWFHFWIWENFREVIYDYRKTSGIRNYYYQWEYLYDTLKEYVEKHPELAPY